MIGAACRAVKVHRWKPLQNVNLQGPFKNGLAGSMHLEVIKKADMLEALENSYKEEIMQHWQTFFI
jgi:hypothetical protein